MDGDGYTRYRKLYTDVDVNDGSTRSIYLKIWQKAASSATYTLYFTTPNFSITGTADDWVWVAVGSPNPELNHDSYDYTVQVLEAGSNVVQVIADGGDDADLDDQLFETIAQDANLFGLSLTKGGTGNGKVKVNSVLHNLPYSEQFTSGASVNLEAVPDADNTFTGWSGSITSNTNPISVTMNANKNITANFAPVIPGVPLDFVGPATANIGQDFELQIQIGNTTHPVTDLKVISFDLMYPTQYINYVTNTPGTFLPSTTAIADDPAGKVSISVYSTTTGASGNGILITVKFHVDASTLPSTSVTFSFLNVQANNGSGTTIPITPGTKTIIITDPGVPVWPGDTNNDGVVNIIDINPIIIYFGSTGPARTPGGISWAGQSCLPWTPIAKTYADCNGNGTVEITDINGVIVNFGKTHTLSSLSKNGFAKNETQLENPLLVVMCDSMNGKLSGQEYWLDVNLGSDALPVTNMNVISFELKYTGTQYIDYLAYEIGSFLSGATPTVIPDDPNGTISVSAFNLTQGYTGYGQTFRFKFKVKDGVTDPQWIQMYWGLVSANTVGGGVQLLDTLGCGDVLVPVELTSFTHSFINNEVRLNWTTATEKNNKGFSVQRSSKGGGWEEISFINGNGTTTQKHTYSYTDRKLSNGLYSYRLKQRDYDGTEAYSDIITVNVSLKLDGFTISQNYPNPFNPATIISYQVPIQSNVQIEVLNVVGEKVAALVNEVKEPGYYEVTWDATSMTSGIYFYVIRANDFSSIKKMLLMK